jgi:acetyl esterase/lipase
VAYRAALAPYYRRVELPAARMRLDIPYRTDADAHPVKHRLDLFLPEGRGWPTVVFVHGGTWTEGDKALDFGGADVYRNIGRFLAANGVGAAIVNYRLIPDVTWQEQPADVAQAVSWVHRNIAAHGGDPDRLVLMGHSAGAQIATLVAVDRRWLDRTGVPASAIAGVIAVSGAGYDITDRRTYELLHHSPHWYARRFHTASNPAWIYDASPIRYVDAADPPFLLMFAHGDPAALRRQSALLQAALARAGVWTWVTPISGLSHSRILVQLARANRDPGATVLRFLEQLSPRRR